MFPSCGLTATDRWGVTASRLLNHWALYNDDVTRQPKIFRTGLEGGFASTRFYDGNTLPRMFGDQGEMAGRGYRQHANGPSKETRPRCTCYS